MSWQDAAMRSTETENDRRRWKKANLMGNNTKSFATWPGSAKMHLEQNKQPTGEKGTTPANEENGPRTKAQKKAKQEGHRRGNAENAVETEGTQLNAVRTKKRTHQHGVGHPAGDSGV